MEILLDILIWYYIVILSLGIILVSLFVFYYREFHSAFLYVPFILPFLLFCCICKWIVDVFRGKSFIIKWRLYFIEQRFLRRKAKKIIEAKTIHFKMQGVERLRVNTDGSGVTSLVILNSCPLHCKYCLNKQTKGSNFRKIGPALMCSYLKKDEVYFRYSGGGITFGGGEPLLQTDAIVEFKKYAPQEWNLNVETSLNVDISCIKALYNVFDSWVIDIKDMNPKIYKAYTKVNNSKVIENLKWMVEHGMEPKMQIRVPLIPGYNTRNDVENSISKLHGMGFRNIETFKYLQNDEIIDLKNQCWIDNY